MCVGAEGRCLGFIGPRAPRANYGPFALDELTAPNLQQRPAIQVRPLHNASSFLEHNSFYNGVVLECFENDAGFIVLIHQSRSRADSCFNPCIVEV